MAPSTFASQRFGNTSRKRRVHEIRRSRAIEDLKKQRSMSCGWRSRLHSRRFLTRWVSVVLCFLISNYLLYNIIVSPQSKAISKHDTSPPRVLQPHSKTRQKKHDPEQWLRDNSNMNHYETEGEKFNDRPKAAIITLVRNEELEGILQSMRQLEYHWNRRYNYPWMFFSEKPFTEEFKVSFWINTITYTTLRHPLPTILYSSPEPPRLTPPRPQQQTPRQPKPPTTKSHQPTGSPQLTPPPPATTPPSPTSAPSA